MPAAYASYRHVNITKRDPEIIYGIPLEGGDNVR